MASRILVSSTRKPMSYINLAKRFLSEHGEVHLSALGVAIGPMVTVAEILKSRELAVVSRLRTSLEDVTVDQRCRHSPQYSCELDMCRGHTRTPLQCMGLSCIVREYREFS